MKYRIQFLIIKFTVDILPPTEFRVETCSNFQQGRNTSFYLDFACRRFGYPAENFKQRGFPGAITADDSHAVTLVYLEGDILKSPKFFGSET